MPYDRRVHIRRAVDRQLTREEIGAAIDRRQEELVNVWLAKRGQAETKRCATCGVWLPFVAFCHDASRPDGLNVRCRACGARKTRESKDRQARRHQTTGWNRQQGIRSA